VDKFYITHSFTGKAKPHDELSGERLKTIQHAFVSELATPIITMARSVFLEALLD